MQREKSSLTKFFDIVQKLEGIFLTIMVIGMLVTLTLQIVGRISGHPFPWTEETSRYLFLWMMFVALASGANEVEYSRVTILLQYSPKFVKKLSEILYAVCVAGIFVFMIIWGWQVVQQQIMFNEMGTALRIPMWIIGICQPIAGVLGLIGVLQSFMEYHYKVAILDRESEKQKDLEKG